MGAESDPPMSLPVDRSVSRVYHGDLFGVLPTLAADSVDACVTDPPYGIGFMGKKWDTFAPAAVKTAAEMKQRKNPELLENQNLKGRKRSPALSPSQIEYDYTVKGLREFQAWTEGWAREVYRVLKPGAYIVVCGAPRSHHRMMCGLEDAGFVVRDCFAWLFGSGFPKSYNELGDGKGTALKPAHEPIALARKPFKGTIKACHEAYGTAALNINACRVGESRPPSQGTGFEAWRRLEGRSDVPDVAPDVDTDKGRWPANVLLDEEAASLLDAQAGDVGGGNKDNRGQEHGFMEGRKSVRNDVWSNADERGGASRFYYVAKPSREERDMGTHHLAPRQRDESRKEGAPGGDNPRNRGLQPRGNFHPTVKPVELMRWLVRLVTPIDGVVIDPFTGSGTTGMACAYEQRRFIGIEREADYVQIANARIASVAPLFTEIA